MPGKSAIIELNAASFAAIFKRRMLYCSMAINPFMRAALKALSYPEILDKKNGYRLQRAAVNASHPHVLRPFYKIWDHHILASDHEVPVRVFSPEVEGVFPMLLFFHGGGWVTGNIDSYDKVCTNMARLTRHIVVSVDYRLAPEHRFPAAPEDCYLAAREIFSQCHLFGITPEDITLIGDSAGGNLAAAVCMRARDTKEFTPRRQVLIYPALNNCYTEESPYKSVRTNGTGYLLTSVKMEDYVTLYERTPEDRNNPYFAPLVAEDFSGLPDTLILTAEYDPLRDEGEEYGRRLQEAGCNVHTVRISGALHGYFALGISHLHVQESFSHINRFLLRGNIGEGEKEDPVEEIR